MPESSSKLLARLADPHCTTGAVAAVFASVASAAQLEQPDRARSLLDSPSLAEDDLAALARFLVRWPEEGAARDCLLAELFASMARRKLSPTEFVHFGARVVATAPPSPLCTAAVEYLKTAGRENEFYALGVAREISEANYVVFCRRGGEPEAPPPPSDWRDWEENGWWRVREDWPIAELFFKLETAEEEVNRRLRRLQSPLIPAAQTLQYFLLYRLRHATTTTLERLGAIGELIESIRDVPELAPLYDRALLVFRNQWKLLPMGELTEMAAEAYLDLCDLGREFEPGAVTFPPRLEGLDVDHLKKNWRQGPERWPLLAPAE